MKKQILVFVLALCMLFSFSLIAQAEGEAVLDHANCGVEGTDWEAVMDEEDYEPATCDEDGFIRKHCSVCGSYVVDEVLPKLSHDYVTVAAKDATCAETGWVEGTWCVNEIKDADGEVLYICHAVEEGKTAPVEIEKLPHTPVAKDPDWKPEDFDCEEGFSTPAVCSVCGDELLDKIHVTFEHQSEVLEAVEPGCETTGLTEGSKCSVCDKILDEQEVIDALEHDWKPVVGTAGSCTEDAVSYHKQCARCGEKNEDYVVLPAPGHETVVVPGYEATCSEDGLTDGEQCTVCGEWIEEQEVIPAHDHNNDTAWKTVLGTAATCTETGIAAHRKCTLCGTVEFNGQEFEGDDAVAAVTIPAHGHVDEPGWENKPAVGKPAASRDPQPELLVKENPDAEKDPTCEEAGYVSALLCPWCGTVREEAEEPEALGHDWTRIAMGRPSTCTDEGISDTWKCENCGITMGNEKIAPRGHFPIPVEAADAKCEETGNIAYSYCDREGCFHAEWYDEDGNLVEVENVEKDEDNNFVNHPADAILPALGHDEKPIPEVAPTCYSYGLDDSGVVCARCEKVIIPANVVDKIRHNFVDVDAEDATCTEDGNLKFKYCSNEGCTLGYIITEDGEDGAELVVTKNEQNVCEEYPAEVVLAALGHDEKAGDFKAATCTEDGYEGGVMCKRCGVTLVDEVVLPAPGHTPVAIPAVAPGCMTTGLTEGEQCEVCEEILKAQEEVPAVGHTYNEYRPAIAATCHSYGYTQGLSCSKCDPVYGNIEGWLIYPEKIDMIDHEMYYAQNLTQAATCEDEGYDNYNYCVNCDYVEGKILPAPGHDWMIYGEKKPTCTEYGLIDARTCRDCGETQEQVKIDPTDHTPVVVEGTPATCDEDGLTDGKKCSVCEEILVAQESIPAPGHNMVHVDAVEPTCEAEGNTEGQKCSNEGCDYSIGIVTIEKLDHILGDWVVEIKPTYENTGLKVKTCLTCGHKIDMDIIDKLENDQLGDVDNDGSVNIVDVMVLLQHCSGLPIVGDFVEANADYNGDGAVDVMDAFDLLYSL